MGITFDRSIVGNGHGAGIAFAAIRGEVDVHEGRAAHDNIGNADSRSRVQARAEIGMHRCAGADEIDERVGVGID